MPAIPRRDKDLESRISNAVQVFMGGFPEWNGFLAARAGLKALATEAHTYRGSVSGDIGKTLKLALQHANDIVRMVGAAENAGVSESPSECYALVMSGAVDFSEDAGRIRANQTQRSKRQKERRKQRRAAACETPDIERRDRHHRSIASEMRQRSSAGERVAPI